MERRASSLVTEIIKEALWVSSYSKIIPLKQSAILGFPMIRFPKDQLGPRLGLGSRLGTGL